jgi:hypothetical protein
MEIDEIFKDFPVEEVPLLKYQTSIDSGQTEKTQIVNFLREKWKRKMIYNISEFLGKEKEIDRFVRAEKICGTYKARLQDDRKYFIIIGWKKYSRRSKEEPYHTSIFKCPRKKCVRLFKWKEGKVLLLT